MERSAVWLAVLAMLSAVGCRPSSQEPGNSFSAYEISHGLAVNYYFELVDAGKLNDPATCGQGWGDRQALWERYYTDGSMDPYRHLLTDEDAFLSECVRGCADRQSFQGRNASCFDG